MRVRTVRDAAAEVKGRRLDARLSQEELARRAGVSRKWVYEFEAGKPAAEFGHVLRVLEVLGLSLEFVRIDAGDRPVNAMDLDELLDEHRRG